MKKIIVILILILGGISIIHSCRKDDKKYIPTPLWLDIPDHFPAMQIPEDNPLTKEGVALGRKLFYDPILSRDNTISCSSCHRPDVSFTDDAQFSEGVDAQVGKRNSMSLVNLAWQKSFFWDGRAETLEEQVFHPVRDPIEMSLKWPDAERKLMEDDKYPELFFQAFGEEGIDSIKTAKAIAQFMRTMISAESKFDLFYKRVNGFNLTDEETSNSFLTIEEQEGFNIFMSETGDCFHCHNLPLLHNNLFSNNGLDATFDDKGLGGVTGNPEDMGRFKVPTLRNIELTGPYMHDGRFETLDEVIEHYSSGLVHSPTLDPLMKNVDDGGVQLDGQQRQYLKAFLLTFTDYNFINNPDFQEPE